MYLEGQRLGQEKVLKLHTTEQLAWTCAEHGTRLWCCCFISVGMRKNRIREKGRKRRRVDGGEQEEDEKEDQQCTHTKTIHKLLNTERDNIQ